MGHFMLGQKPKVKVIQETIRGQLRRGELTPGDRVASIKDLCAHFRAGQKTVRSALRGLEEEGIIEIRDRSGSYVCEGALDAIERVGEGKPVPESPAGGDLKNYLMPRRSTARTIRLYVTDLDVLRLALWREVLDGFSGVEVELVSCNEGHLEDVYASDAPDVVETTPAVLRAVGPEEFLPADAILSVAGVEPHELIAPVRERMESGRMMGGAPFAVTLQYLFVNLDLAEMAGMEEYPADPFEMLTGASRAKRALRERGAEPFVLPTCLDVLLMSGAVVWDREEGLQFWPERARRIFRVLNACAPPAASTDEVLPRFTRGELLYLVHCSFMLSEFVGNLSFRWKALPLPVAPGARMPGWLSVLAVSRNASHPDECAELVAYLSRPDVQGRFADLPGNLPVHRAAMSRMPVAAGEVLSGETLERAVSQLTLNWPEEAHAAVHRHFDMPGVRSALSRGAFRPGEAVERLRRRLDIAPWTIREASPVPEVPVVA